jgi:hypothetical protein
MQNGQLDTPTLGVYWGYGPRRGRQSCGFDRCSHPQRQARREGNQAVGRGGGCSCLSPRLGAEHLFGPDDPLFPATAMGVGKSGCFQPQGLARHGWASSGPIRVVFRRAFEVAGLPYYNPHSFRGMLVRHTMTLDLPPEEMRSWTQNLGHAEVMTTFTIVTAPGA